MEHTFRQQGSNPSWASNTSVSDSQEIAPSAQSSWLGYVVLTHKTRVQIPAWKRFQRSEKTSINTRRSPQVHLHLQSLPSNLPSFLRVFNMRLLLRVAFLTPTALLTRSCDPAYLCNSGDDGGAPLMRDSPTHTKCRVRGSNSRPLEYETQRSTN